MSHYLRFLALVVIIVAMTIKTVTTIRLSPSGRCYETEKKCQMKSAEQTRTHWEICHHRCLCLGYRGGKCHKETRGCTQCYQCICYGTGSANSEVNYWCSSSPGSRQA